MIFGLILAVITLYFGLEIVLSFTVGREVAFGLVAIPFLLVYVLFKKRK